MRNYIEYKGYCINKTGKSFQDYHVKIGTKHSWGTLSEIRQDIDDYLSRV